MRHGVVLYPCDMGRLPYIKTSKAVLNLSKKQKSKTSGLDVWLKGIATWISKRMRMSEFKRIGLEADLKTAQMDITPEMFKANP